MPDERCTVNPGSMFEGAVINGRCSMDHVHGGDVRRTSAVGLWGDLCGRPKLGCVQGLPEGCIIVLSVDNGRLLTWRSYEAE